jgi:hypothetical protein
MEELEKHEKQALERLNERQKELLEEAVAGAGVIYRFKLEEDAHPTIRFGIGEKRYPPPDNPAAGIYEIYNRELENLAEKRIINRCGSDAFFLSWSGWRIARAMMAAE